MRRFPNAAFATGERASAPRRDVAFLGLARCVPLERCMLRWRLIGFVFLGLTLSAHGQIVSGAGTIATGPVKGAGKAAKDTAKGAGEVVTLHPIKGTESVTKGAVGAGKDVTVGAVKGTGKIAKGVGNVFKKVF